MRLRLKKTTPNVGNSHGENETNHGEDQSNLELNAPEAKYRRPKKPPVYPASYLRATHGSPDRPLKIGDVEMTCYVLEDGTRVLSGRGMQSALGLGQASGRLLSKFFNTVLLRPGIKDLVSEPVRAAIDHPIRFLRPGRGGKLAVGFEATLLADLCDIILEARHRGLLDSQEEQDIATYCEMLTRAFAKVGIIALVDEATGYQTERTREALQDILKKLLLSEQLRKWAKTFPDEFYRELFRVYGYTYSEVSSKRPLYVGKLTNDLIYCRLPAPVLKELQEKNPRLPSGRRQHKHFQWLSEDYGAPALKDHFVSLITLLKASPSNGRAQFNRLVQRALPRATEVHQGVLIDVPDDEEQT